MWEDRDKWKRKWKRQGVSINEITYANGEEGTLNVYMCVQLRERAKKLVIRYLLTKWMNSNSFSERHTRIVNFEDTRYYCHLCSKFFVENVEHCSTITLFKNGKRVEVCPVFQRIYVENWPSLSFFNMGNMIHLHYGADIAYSHVFSSCFSKNFLVFSLLVSCKQT